MGQRGPKPRPLLERLDDMSEWQGDCLVWLGTRNPKGYGSTKIAGKTVTVHRAAWIHQFGPTDLNVLHTCDNPPCWNPSHLFLGTIADNNRDMRDKGRASGGRAKFPECRYGHPYDAENTYLAGDGA